LSRHKNVSLGSNDTTHWHIDYLIKNPNIFIIGAFISRSSEECEISDSIEMDNIKNFGCSDCDCKSHLYYNINASNYFTKIRTVFEDNSSSYQFISKNNFEDLG
jgi:Uri superfamily endonuclease